MQRFENEPFLGRPARRRPVLSLGPAFPNRTDCAALTALHCTALNCAARSFSPQPLSPSCFIFFLRGVAGAHDNRPPFCHFPRPDRDFNSGFFFFSLLPCPRRRRCAFSDADCHLSVRAASSCRLRQDGGQEETRVGRCRRLRPAQQAAGRQRQQQVQGRLRRHERRGLDRGELCHTTVPFPSPRHPSSPSPPPPPSRHPAPGPPHATAVASSFVPRPRASKRRGLCSASPP